MNTSRYCAYASQNICLFNVSNNMYTFYSWSLPSARTFRRPPSLSPCALTDSLTCFNYSMNVVFWEMWCRAMAKTQGSLDCSHLLSKPFAFHLCGFISSATGIARMSDCVAQHRRKLNYIQSENEMRLYQMKFHFVWLNLFSTACQTQK